MTLLSMTRRRLPRVELGDGELIPRTPRRIFRRAAALSCCPGYRPPANTEVQRRPGTLPVAVLAGADRHHAGHGFSFEPAGEVAFPAPHGSVHALRHGRGYPGGGGFRVSISRKRTASVVAPSWEFGHRPRRHRGRGHHLGAYPHSQEVPRRSTSPSSLRNMVAGHLEHRLAPVRTSSVSARSTSTHAIGFAMRCIQYGDADVIIAGGSECDHADGAGGLQPRPGRFPSATTTPQAASRPWDKDRDGFVMGRWRRAGARGTRARRGRAGRSMRKSWASA